MMMTKARMITRTMTLGLGRGEHCQDGRGISETACPYGFVFSVPGRRPGMQIADPRLPAGVFLFVWQQPHALPEVRTTSALPLQKPLSPAGRLRPLPRQAAYARRP